MLKRSSSMILAPMSNFRLSVRLEVLIKNWQLVYWFCCCFLHQPFSVLIGSISVQRSLASSYSSALQPFLKSPSFFFSFLHLIFSTSPVFCVALCFNSCFIFDSLFCTNTLTGGKELLHSVLLKCYIDI